MTERLARLTGRYRFTPTPVTAPAWALCAATGSAAVFKVGNNSPAGAYFHIYEAPQSGPALFLVVRCEGAISDRAG